MQSSKLEYYLIKIIHAIVFLSVAKRDGRGGECLCYNVMNARKCCKYFPFSIARLLLLFFFFGCFWYLNSVDNSFSKHINKSCSFRQNRWASQRFFLSPILFSNCKTNVPAFLPLCRHESIPFCHYLFHSSVSSKLSVPVWGFFCCCFSLVWVPPPPLAVEGFEFRSHTC
jgi:hypothetical protein